MEEGDLEIEGLPLSNAGRSGYESFDDFYRRDYGDLVALALALSGSRAAAEDLAEDGFLLASREPDELGGTNSRERFVRRLVTKASVDRYRRMAAEARARTRALSPRRRRPPIGAVTDAELWATIAGSSDVIAQIARYQRAIANKKRSGKLIADPAPERSALVSDGLRPQTKQVCLAT